MANYDERLRLLREQVSRKKQIEAQLIELRKQRNELSAKEMKLRGFMLSEQSDVDHLEGGSLASFFYNVIGKMDEKLNKEREEAYAAKVKHDAAVSELRLAEHDISSLEGELDELFGCEIELEKVMDEKMQAIKDSGSAHGAEILRLEEKIHSHENQIRELREAIQAGERALATTNSITQSLDDAEGWGTFDLLGGGLIADIAKHGHLDDAQREVNELQHQLRSFKTELADVAVDANMQISIDGFLGFADFFFDGLFADWAVMDKISQSQEEVRKTRDQINRLLSSLSSRLDKECADAARSRAALEALVAETSL